MSDFQIRVDGKPSAGFLRNIELLKNRTPNKYSEISILISQPRTGSTMVCDYLTKCSEIGWCDEWLNPFFIKTVADEINTKSMQITFNWIMSRAASQNGKASINIQVPDIIYWKAKGIDFSRMANKFAYLYRRNKIQQAISLVKATKTKRYYSLNEKENDLNIALDITEILAALGKIAVWDTEYVQKIKKEDLLEIAYEDLSDHTQINRILMCMGCQTNIKDLPETSLRKQRTSKDLEYASQLIRYFEQGSLELIQNFKK